MLQLPIYLGVTLNISTSSSTFYTKYSATASWTWWCTDFTKTIDVLRSTARKWWLRSPKTQQHGGICLQSSMTMRSLLLVFFITKSSVGIRVELCMNAYPNLHITCALAYAQRAVLNEQQCRDLCLQMSARTCQYEKSRKQCELYDVVVALQSKNPLRKGQGRIRRSLNEIKIVKQGSGISGTSHCTPSVAPAIGFLLFVNDGCPSTGSTSEQSINAADSRDTAVGRLGNPVRITDGNKLPVVDITANGTIGTTNLQLPTPYYLSNSAGFRAADSLPIVQDCAPKFSPRIEVIDGIQVVAEGLATFQTHTLEACLYTCTKNILVDGSRLPTACRSAQYDRISQRCILFGTTITPTGNAQYISNEDIIYFEKICISNVVRMRCGRAMRRVPQYILVGHATAVIDAPSHNYCVEVCLRSLEVLGFACRSVVHFYEYSKSNCILNKDSAKIRPEYFTSESEQKVDYVELDECQIATVQKDDVTWSEWSECDQDAGLRSRERKCPTCSTEVDQAPCFSGKDFRGKFADLYAEQELDRKLLVRE